MDGELQLKPLGQCTLEEITELWNVGFSQYLNDMATTTERMTIRLGNCHIHPGLSVAAYIDHQPAGFVMVGLREIRGIKTAWNGGTGVNPAFRGRGISKLILKEVVKRLKEAKVDLFSLETRVENTPAIAAYRSIGFESVYRMPIYRRTGAFEQVPFQKERRADYIMTVHSPAAVSELSFYLHTCAWNNQWFNMKGGQSLIVYDRTGEAIGYALYNHQYDDWGQLSSIRLTHCEPIPTRSDGNEIVRVMLSHIFAPFDEPITRIAHYIRSTNAALVEALVEAGFTLDMEEHLMMLDLHKEVKEHLLEECE